MAKLDAVRLGGRLIAVDKARMAFEKTPILATPEGLGAYSDARSQYVRALESLADAVREELSR